MNGNEQKIFDEIIKNGNRLTKLETLQKEQHRVNKDDIKIIKDKIDKVNGIKGQIMAQWFLIAGLFAWTFFK